MYIEDQYLWSPEVASSIAKALVRNRELQVIVVVPRYPDQDDTLAGPPSRLGQQRAIAKLRRAGADRVGVFDLENRDGTPIYVHAKICVVDDTWATCGSDNFNRRSWTTDSELTCAVFDTSRDEADASAGGFARGLRRQLWAEHLGLAPDDPRLEDSRDALALWKDTAHALDRWHANGGDTPRPPGQIRPHRVERITRLQSLWSDPLYRVLLDPDSRPRRLRGTSIF
ncbi:phospholipase D-like domain-containing protein [Leifsonia poae]|uniref:phospholipase D-like domain-containing protein n=1 Tax=Leifsonia poae TaxID=110933 RepID=UPI003D699482